MSRIKCLLVGAVACFPSAARAQAFNFDGLAVGTYSSISQTIGGQTLTVAAVSIPAVATFIDALDPQALLLGAVSLVGRAEHLGFVFTNSLQFSFLNPVSAITFAFGDNGGDDDSPARIQAFDAFNNLLGVFDTPYPAGKNDGATRTLTFGSAGASSFVVSSGPTDVKDFFWEVAASTPAALTAAPEPASVALVGSGLILLGAVYRRRREAYTRCQSCQRMWQPRI